MKKKALINNYDKEKAYEESHKSLVKAIENMTDSFITLDPKWRYLYVNRNAEDLLGHKREYLIGKNIFKIFPQVKKTLFYTKAKKALKTNKPTKFDTYSERLNKWMEIRLYPLTNAISLYFTDISARKRAEFRQEFISKINSTIALSLDYNLALQNVAKVIVHYLADICHIIILDENGKNKDIYVNHTNPKKVNFAVNLNSVYGINQIIKKGKSEVISKIDDKLLKNFKINGLQSYMGVPLVIKGNIVGAIILASINPNRRYSKDDLALVEGVASRVALALENMRLFERVQKERERLELGQSAGKIGTFEWDIKNNKSTWTPGFSSLFGSQKSPENGIIEKWLSMVHPDDQSMIKKITQKALADEDKLILKFRVIWQDKSIHYISAKAKIFRDKIGKPVRMTGAAIDITHRKIIEHELNFLAEASKILSSSLNYKATLNTVAQLAVSQIADLCTVEIIENGKVEKIAVTRKGTEKIKFAKKINALIGLTNIIQTGVSELYPLVSEELLKKLTKNKKHYNFTKNLEPYSIIISPILRQRKTIGAITLITTKQSKKQFTQEDLIMAEKLADRVALAIDNSILYHKSQEATKLREAFISIASHELKTPITSLKVYTQVLRQQAEKQGNTNLGHYLLKMDQQVEKLSKLIRDLLDTSRMQLGKIAFRKEYFNLDELVKEVVDAIQLTHQNHNIVIKGKAGSVFGDKDRIGQVLINLLINAIKYSPEADKVIVNLSNQDSQVLVNVRDYGVGIDKKNQRKIFERFYQIDQSGAKTTSGLGIGLYIATEIVKRHGGNIWVESNKGKGSTFSFVIPSKIN